MTRLSVLSLALTSVPLAYCGLSAARADTLELQCDAPTSTMELDLCLSAESERLDTELEQAFHKARERMTRGEDCISACPEAERALLAAQQSWTVFREHDCNAAYAVAVDGTGRNAARLQCLIDHTRIRTQQLSQPR